MVFPDRQTAVADQPSYLTGRHRAPTWGPTPWGGEGTPSLAAVAHPAGPSAVPEDGGHPSASGQSDIPARRHITQPKTTIVPTADEIAGMAWWNGLSVQNRKFWIQWSKSAIPAEAWEYFKAARLANSGELS